MLYQLILHTPSNPQRVSFLVTPEQWQELGAGEPGRQGPAAPRDRHRDQEAADPPAGSRGCWRCEKKRRQR